MTDKGAQKGTSADKKETDKETQKGPKKEMKRGLFHATVRRVMASKDEQCVLAEDVNASAGDVAKAKIQRVLAKVKHMKREGKVRIVNRGCRGRGR
jgi:hypothetical protein